MNLNKRRILKLYNLARGTVRIKLNGVNPEKVLNAVSEAEIEFWDAEYIDDFSMLITVRAAKLCDTINLARRNGCETEIIFSRGGKELTKRAKRRAALILGLALCIMLSSVSSLFIWDIEVIGNDTVSYGEVLRILSENGVRCGVFRPSISADSVENDILLNHPALSWISLNMNSSRLVVKVRERRVKPDIVDEAAARSIFASKSGIIEKISVLQGRAAVSNGDTVCAGDLLVLGEIESETGDTRSVHAMAEITARTWYEITAVAPVTERKKTAARGSKTKISILLGKNRINFYSDSRNNAAYCDKINELGYIQAEEYFMIPVGIALQTSKKYIISETDADREKTVQRLKDDLLSELRYRIGSGEIASHSYSVSESNGLVSVTLLAECLENIADNGD